MGHFKFFISFWPQKFSAANPVHPRWKFRFNNVEAAHLYRNVSLVPWAHMILISIQWLGLSVNASWCWSHDLVRNSLSLSLALDSLLLISSPIPPPYLGFHYKNRKLSGFVIAKIQKSILLVFDFLRSYCRFNI